MTTGTVFHYALLAISDATPKTGDRELSRVFRHYDYCLDNENVIIKDYLVNRGMTDTDFMLEKKKELMYVINKDNWT